MRRKADGSLAPATKGYGPQIHPRKKGPGRTPGRRRFRNRPSKITRILQQQPPSGRLA